MGPQADGEHEGVVVRVGGGGDHGELGSRLSFMSNIGLFACHHVQALVLASNLTYGNPHFPPPSGHTQPNNKVCNGSRTLYKTSQLKTVCLTILNVIYRH